MINPPPFIFLPLFVIATVAVAVSSCGQASGNGFGLYRAERIAGPEGVECFVIVDGANNAVGGNCK